MTGQGANGLNEYPESELDYYFGIQCNRCGETVFIGITTADNQDYLTMTEIFISVGKEREGKDD